MQRRNHQKILRKKISDFTQSLFSQFAEALPENNYWGFAGYTVIAPEILSHLTSYSLPQSDAVGPTWNYLDAACQGVTGLKQLFDKATHRPAVTKGKGLLNLASSIQLLTLTTLSASVLGPIGFAAAAGTSFLLSLDDSFRQLRRWYYPEYFFVDNLAELDKIQELLKAKEDDLKALRALPAKDRFSKSGKLALKLAVSTQESLLESRTRLQQEMKIKLDMDRIEHGENSSLRAITLKYNRALIKTPECEDFLNLLSERAQPKGDTIRQQVRRDAEQLDNQSQLAFFLAAADSILWGMAFAGMLLICIPGMQGFAFGFIAAASLLFLLKNSAKLAAKPRQLSRFFKMTLPQVGEEGTELMEIKGTSLAATLPSEEKRTKNL